jgi:hypothetical protein
VGVIAIPTAPTTDPKGQITDSAEAIFEEYGDEHVLLGTRDVRISKFAQDLKPGEVALLNADGHRLFLGRKKGALVIGGGYLSFDVEKKSVGLVGIPATPGGSAPYISISPTILGLVSGSGKSSITLSDANISMSGAAIVFDFGRVSLGKNATDPVVTFSALARVIQQITTQFLAHTHASIGAPPSAPLILILTPGTRVFAPQGG